MTITQVRSANGATREQKATLLSLGLRGIGQTVEREENPQMKGMVHAVRHLVRVDG